MRRRQVLRSLSLVGLWPLAGCLDNSDGSTPSTTTSEATTRSTTLGPFDVGGVNEFPTTKPDVDVECGDDVLEPVERPYEDHRQAVRGLEVSASTERLVVGEDVTFSLRNTTPEKLGVGNITKYNIQREVDGDWEPVFQTTEYTWYDDAYDVYPGAGYDWSFTFTQEGLERDHPTPGVNYLVCSPLEAGTYRFVFWGTGDAPVGTEFSVETT